MLRTPVNSSNVSSVGYDKATQTLEVEFKDSSVYVYFGVPAFLYDGLMRAASKGSFLAQHIKGHYRYQSVR
jgi:hypothetical protein